MPRPPRADEIDGLYQALNRGDVRRNAVRRSARRLGLHRRRDG